MGNQPSGLRWTNPGEAERLRRQLLPYGEAEKRSRQAQALADPTRLLLLSVLREAKETCVGDLCLITEREQGGVSRHLRILLDAGLVERRSVHRLALYKLSENGQRLLSALLNE